MEPRPIDGNALYDMIQDNACHDVMSVADVLNFIENAPTLDLAPVVHGQWIKEELTGYEPYYLCSVCGKLHHQNYNFCNNCGAKMEA